MENHMSSTKFLLVLITLLLYLSNYGFKASGNDVTQCLNCSKCEYPCQEQPSPPLASGAPQPLGYGAPPPLYGYSIYGSPPPPKEKNPSKCPPPPPAGVECCTSFAPFVPPNPYIPVPYGEGQRCASMLVPVLMPLMMLFSSFVFLF